MAAVFISYSRKDFYFAESLAFHLTRGGTSAWLDSNQLSPGSDWEKDLENALSESSSVVLVGSRASSRSAYVTAEWRRALDQKKRIIIARFGAFDLPPALADAEVIDFRGAFQPALQKLQGLLAAPARAEKGESGGLGKRRLPRLPSWIAFMGLLLSSLFLIPLVAMGKWDDLRITQEALWLRILFWIVFPFFLWFIAWHTCVAFLRRRMGMTRLALTIAFFTGVFAFNLLQHFGAEAYPRFLGGATSPLAQERWPAAICLVLVGLCGLTVVVLVRPEDFLRWVPTGKAWNSYRRGRVSRVPDLRTRFAEVKSFELLYDLEDATAAAQLSHELEKAGASKAILGDPNATKVVLLTNRTRIVWLDQHAARLQKAVVTVVGTAIALPDSLRWLWRRQWIDFRRWDARKRCKVPVPAVPEAMTRLRIPTVVTQTEHLLCAMTALTFTAGGAIMPENNDTVSLGEILGGTTTCASVAWGMLVWRLVHRKLSEKTFSRYLLFTSIGTTIFGFGSLIFWLRLDGEILRVLPAAIFLIAAPLLLRRQQQRLQFWFLAPAPTEKNFAPRLAGRRNWEPILWILAYTMLWMWMLNMKE